MSFNIIFSVIVIILAIVMYILIRKSIRWNRAERRLRQYPHAAKGVFGYSYNISLDNESDINIFNAEAHDEDFWIKKEKEESERCTRCEKLMKSYPNGWNSWKELNPRVKEDMKVVDRSAERIMALEDCYAKFQVFQEWKTRQDGLTTMVLSNGGKREAFEVDGCDRFGNDYTFLFPVAHIYNKFEDCKTANIEINENYTSSIKALANIASGLDENVVFLTLPECDKYLAQFEELGLESYSIGVVHSFSWSENQVFIIVTDVADSQRVRYISEVFASDMVERPAFVIFSVVKSETDTECNIRHYREYSARHNTDNSYSVDEYVEKHPYMDGYYYTVKNKLFKTIKKAMSAYFHKFDTDTIAVKTSRSHKYDYSSIYYEKSPEEIKQMWAEKRDSSAKLNRKLRQDIADILSGRECERDSTSELFDMYNETYDISPYRTNWNIFDMESGIVGTVDCLAYQDGQFVLYSWVRSDNAIQTDSFFAKHYIHDYLVDDRKKKSFIKSYFDSGKKNMAFAKLDDCKFTKYSIEQHVIINILCKNYGIEVKDSFIVILHPDFNIPIALRPDDCSKEVVQFMINEKRNNRNKPTIVSEFNVEQKTEVTETDVESIEMMELF